MEKVKKALESCPICDADLIDVVLELKYVKQRLFLERSFCPQCKVVRSSFFGQYTALSFLNANALPMCACVDCGSVWFIQKIEPFVIEKEKKCWLCGGKVKSITDVEFERLGIKKPIGLQQSEMINEMKYLKTDIRRSGASHASVIVLDKPPLNNS